MNEGYTTTADYEHINAALKSFWNPFQELIRDIDSFKPRPNTDFDNKRKELTEQTLKLNPTMSIDEIGEVVERRIAVSEAPDMQFMSLFSERLMTMYVTVTLLSQALCEAEINAILATGLFEKKLADQFMNIQKNDFKDKWVNGPKLYCPSYELIKGSSLYETLNHLNKQRNVWMHHKSHLHVGEEKVIKGSDIKRITYQEIIRWMKRYFSLPYDLAAHIQVQTQQTIAFVMNYNRSPIPTADAHK